MILVLSCTLVPSVYGMFPLSVLGFKDDQCAADSYVSISPTRGSPFPMRGCVLIALLRIQKPPSSPRPAGQGSCVPASYASLSSDQGAMLTQFIKPKACLVSTSIFSALRGSQLSESVNVFPQSVSCVSCPAHRSSLRDYAVTRHCSRAARHSPMLLCCVLHPDFQDSHPV